MLDIGLEVDVDNATDESEEDSIEEIVKFRSPPKEALDVTTADDELTDENTADADTSDEADDALAMVEWTDCDKGKLQNMQCNHG